MLNSVKMRILRWNELGFIKNCPSPKPKPFSGKNYHPTRRYIWSKLVEPENQEIGENQENREIRPETHSEPNTRNF